MTQIALITGISRGIGQEFAKQLVERGYFVIGTCRNPDQVTPHDQLAVETLDVRDDAAIQMLAKKYEKTSIDLLINNAGVLYADSQVPWGADPTEIGSFSRSGMIETFDVNTVSTLKITEAFVPHILKSEQKTIVALSSSAGSIASNESGGMIAYRMSKAALNMGMQEFAIKLHEQGVHVLLLHPGWVQTSMGGQNATVSVNNSVKGMLDVIENKGSYRSGGFYDYEGQERPY